MYVTLNYPKITHPEKIIFEDEKLTKMDIVNYYKAAASLMLPHISDRPLTLLRCPEGASSECFIQRHSGTHLPQNVHTVVVKEKKADRKYMWIDSEQGIISLIQNGSLELHTWNSRRKHIEKPDQIVMDFDPSPGFVWKQILDAAFDLKKILDQLGLESFVKLSGGKGIHVHIPFRPIYTWEHVKTFAHGLAQQMKKQSPELYTDQMLKKSRQGKIFVDYLRNTEGATAVAPYSVRAREHSAVAMPIDWDELPDSKAANQFNLVKAIHHLRKRRHDPWSEYFKTDQRIGLLEKRSSYI